MSVYCGYCSQRGHNKLGCPERKAAAEANPDGYIGRQVKYEKETRARTVANRTCTYCRQPGHNRAGCKVMKEDKKTVTEKLVDYRSRFLNRMREVGFGVGSLVKTKSLVDPEFEEVHMITEINWEQINTKLIDSDLTGWSAIEHNENTAFQSRIVATTFPEDWDGESYWQKKPAIMDQSHVEPKWLYAIMGEELINTGSRPEIVVRAGSLPRETAGAQLIGPVSKINPSEDFLNPSKLTFDFARYYHFQHVGNADEWDKRRNPARFEREDHEHEC